MTNTNILVYFKVLEGVGNKYVYETQFPKIQRLRQGLSTGALFGRYNPRASRVKAKGNETRRMGRNGKMMSYHIDQCFM